MLRDQPMLLPPDMREWLPAGHPVWLLIAVVSEHLDTSAVHAATRRLGGAGAAGYDPDMVVTLLIWAWARGVRSSRRIERLCVEDVSFRVICGGNAPDHVTISRFRAATRRVTPGLFAQVLWLCARLGLGRLDTIALDGVKIAADASTRANRDAERLREMAERIAAEHEAADHAEDALFGVGRSGDEVPAEAAEAGTRGERIAAALADLQAELDAERAAAEQRRQAAAGHVAGRAAGQAPIGRPPEEIAVEVAQVELARAIAAQQAKIDSYPRRRAAAGTRGRPLKPPAPVDQHHRVRRWRDRLDRAVARRERRQAAKQTTAGKRVRNLTDPDSRLMPTRGGGWIQGYNCQAVTTADGLILAVSTGNNPADVGCFQPMMRAAEHAADLIGQASGHPHTAIGIILADAGYFSEANLTAPGPDRLIAAGTARNTERAARATPADRPPPPNATPAQTMIHRLRTPDGIATYRQRGHIAETPFGHAKHNLGFRRFTARGLPAAHAEWTFHATVHNLLKAIGTGKLATLTS